LINHKNKRQAKRAAEGGDISELFEGKKARPTAPRPREGRENVSVFQKVNIL